MIYLKDSAQVERKENNNINTATNYFITDCISLLIDDYDKIIKPLVKELNLQKQEIPEFEKYFVRAINDLAPDRPDRYIRAILFIRGLRYRNDLRKTRAIRKAINKGSMRYKDAPPYGSYIRVTSSMDAGKYRIRSHKQPKEPEAILLCHYQAELQRYQAFYGNRQYEAEKLVSFKMSKEFKEIQNEYDAKSKGDKTWREKIGKKPHVYDEKSERDEGREWDEVIQGVEGLELLRETNTTSHAYKHWLRIVTDKRGYTKGSLNLYLDFLGDNKYMGRNPISVHKALIDHLRIIPIKKIAKKQGVTNSAIYQKIEKYKPLLIKPPNNPRAQKLHNRFIKCLRSELDEVVVRESIYLHKVSDPLKSHPLQSGKAAQLGNANRRKLGIE